MLLGLARMAHIWRAYGARSELQGIPSKLAASEAGASVLEFVVITIYGCYPIALIGLTRHSEWPTLDRSVFVLHTRNYKLAVIACVRGNRKCMGEPAGEL